MTIQEIEIKQTKQPFGFSKPSETTLAGALFPNGKIAYLDNEDIYVASDEKALVKSLKQGSCVGVDIVHKH